MVKSTLTFLFLVTFLIGLVAGQQSLVVITSNKFDKPVLDTQKLEQHSKNNQVPKYMVDSSKFQSPSFKVVKDMLISAGMKQQNVNSFILQAEQLEQSFKPVANKLQEVSVQDLAQTLVKKPQSIIYIINKEKHRRILQTGQTTTSSKLFLNMTPAIASGLFVAVFLIVMLLIAISCLYDIKTNDKFGSTHLTVGKQS